MNFFSDKPDARFTNLTEVARSLDQDYVEVKREFQLGDVILLMKTGSDAIHSCNYVADRLVFTKNGGSMAQPWILARLDDIVDFYSYPDPVVSVKIMRRRDLMNR